MSRFEDILADVSKQSGIPVSALLNPKARKTVTVRWKAFLCWRARKETEFSYPEIARRSNCRDHSTVLFRVRKFEKALIRDEEWAVAMHATVIPRTPRKEIAALRSQKPRDIVEAVCIKHDVPLKDIKSYRISPHIVRARREAIFRLREIGMKQADIARLLNRTSEGISKAITAEKNMPNGLWNTENICGLAKPDQTQVV